MYGIASDLRLDFRGGDCERRARDYIDSRTNENKKILDGTPLKIGML
jgi:hypothetical protein